MAGRRIVGLAMVSSLVPFHALQVNEPVASNYYPITAGAAITDGCLGAAVATDRSQGAASLQDGQLEVMLHRWVGAWAVKDDVRWAVLLLNKQTVPL